MQIENSRELAREELATTEIMEEMAAQDIGSSEADVAELVVCTKKTQRKARYANCVHPHAYTFLFAASSDIVDVHIQEEKSS